MFHCVIDCSCGWEFSSRIIWFNWHTNSQCDAKIKINHETDHLDLNQTHWLNNDDKASLVCIFLWIFMGDINSIQNLNDLLHSAASVHGILIHGRSALMLIWESHQGMLGNCTINLISYFWLLLALVEFLHLITLTFPILYIDFQFTHEHDPKKLYSDISMHRR